MREGSSDDGPLPASQLVNWCGGCTVLEGLKADRVWDLSEYGIWYGEYVRVEGWKGS